MTAFQEIFFKKDTSKLLNKLGHIPKKYDFRKNTFFSHHKLHKFLHGVPKYLSIAQFLPYLCLTYPAGIYYYMLLQFQMFGT